MALIESLRHRLRGASAGASQGLIPFETVHPGIERHDFKPQPLHIVGPNQYAFAPGQGACAKPILMNSVPKAGTYMFGLLLKELGMIETEIMVAHGWLWDHRGLSQEEVVFAPDDHIAGLYFKDAAKLVQPGQFVTGHLAHSAEDEARANNMVVFLAVRELKDALVSHMRFLADPKRRDAPLERWLPLPDGPARFLGYLEGPGKGQIDVIRSMAPWIARPGVTVCRYEDAVGDNGEPAQDALFEAMAAALGLFRRKQVRRVFDAKVMNRQTRTFSGARSAFTPYDTPEVAAALETLGVSALNRLYGYP